MARPSVIIGIMTTASLRLADIGARMKIRLASVMAGDQGRALRFPVGITGFVKRRDFPMVFDETCVNVVPTGRVG